MTRTVRGPRLASTKLEDDRTPAGALLLYGLEPDRRASAPARRGSTARWVYTLNPEFHSPFDSAIHLLSGLKEFGKQSHQNIPGEPYAAPNDETR